MFFLFVFSLFVLLFKQKLSMLHVADVSIKDVLIIHVFFISNVFFEPAKLRALRAKSVLTCQRALRAYVLTCQRASFDATIFSFAAIATEKIYS